MVVLRELEACDADVKSLDDTQHNVTIRCLSIGLKENYGQSGNQANDCVVGQQTEAAATSRRSSCETSFG